MFKAVALAVIGAVALFNGAEVHATSVVSASFEMEAADAAFIQLEADIQAQTGFLSATSKKDAWLTTKESELSALKKKAKAAKETYTEVRMPLKNVDQSSLIRSIQC